MRPIIPASLSPDLRIALIRKAIGIFFLAGIALSFPLWTGDRLFPATPILDLIKDLRLSSDIFFLTILVISLGLSFFSSYRGFVLLSVFSITIMMVCDQMRWQPWVYLYTLMLIAFLITDDSPQGNRMRLNNLRIILTGVYFWSGAHKLNPNFIDHTYRDIITRFLNIQNISETMLTLGYVIPLTEITMGLALLTSRFRNAAVCLAAFSHIFILLFLSPLGINANSVVYPWNLAMIVFVVLLFWNEKAVMVFSFSKLHRNIGQLSFILLIWILPFLNFFGMWDHFLSFSLYSDNENIYYIAIEEKELPKIDDRLRPFLAEVPGISGGRLIDINKWTLNELNVPFYPERRVFKVVAKTFCDLGIEEGKIIFLELKRPFREGEYFNFTCKDL
jgi:hypothetical protein